MTERKWVITERGINRYYMIKEAVVRRVNRKGIGRNLTLIREASLQIKKENQEWEICRYNPQKS